MFEEVDIVGNRAAVAASTQASRNHYEFVQENTPLYEIA